MKALLDVNVLLALLDANHLHHSPARTWFEQEISHGWVSCAITQNGVVRILSQPSYPNPLSLRGAAQRLRRATEQPHHTFWPSAVSLLDPAHIDFDRLYGPKQITDAYLLALAVAHGGRLVTLDRNLPTSAVPAAKPEHLVQL